jgi:leucyl aminopeptidase
MVRIQKIAGIVALVACGVVSTLAAPVPRDLVVIPQSAQPTLIDKAIPVTFKASGFFLAEWDEAAQQKALADGIPFQIIRRDVSDSDTFYLFELHEGDQPPGTWAPLYRSGLNVIVEMNDDEAIKWSLAGQHAVRLWHTANGWGNAATKVAYDCTPKPLITEILGKTSQAQWLDWDEKISGVEPIDVDGTSYTVATRYTSSLFSGAANAKAYDFLKQQVQAWNFTGTRFEEDPFTTGIPGKNIIITIPGTSANEVLFTAHFDSIWQSGSSTTSAPGANDNGTGSSTLLEAARILRQYRFTRTIKLIWFTGEEQGLFGSAAYVADHSMFNVVGVLNLDMFGYDANNDKCFEIHAGTLPASIDVANCMNASITSYATGLTRDFLTTTATNRSDHASFWNAGVGAIEIAENFFNDAQAGGCVGSEPNPFYHTNNDTIAGNMHPSYAFAIAKTALATISAMAIPLNSCFAAGVAPSISASGGVNQVDVNWAAVPGAATYRVYRAKNGCGGNFVSVGTTAGTTFTDPMTAPGSYAYKVEAVDPDGICVSAESNCANATPTVYHATPTTVTYTDVCATGGPGNGNGVVEPGESVTMQVTLKNDSDTTLTGITGVLSSTTPGVTVSDPSAAWPDLGPFASAATLPDHFHFQVSPSATCGTNMDLQVQANALQSSGFTSSYPKLVGAPGSSSGTYPSTDSLPRVLVDIGTVNSPNVINATGTVVDVNVRLNITHTWDADLDIYLRHPDGTLVELTTDNGSSGDNYNNTLFDDEAVASIVSQAAPFTGTFRPEGLLSALDGKPAAGTWQLVVTDDEGQDTGTLNSWSLDLVTSAAPICNVCTPAAVLPGDAGPLMLAKSGTDLAFTWGPSGCSASGYGLYRGDLAALQATGLYSHDTALACGIAGTAFALPIADAQLGDAAYFVVVAATGTDEGTYGKSSAAVERPVSTAACKASQNLAVCP